MRSNSGFTLVEMVVVLAVVAILAAILVPNIAQSINDAKVARASNEALVIGSAMASFYKDLGFWPIQANTGTVALPIYAATPPVTRLRTASGSDARSLAAAANPWVTAGAGDDTFENQLTLNTPMAGTAYPNATAVTTQTNLWRGPYATEIKADPWGRRYYCNATALAGVANAVWVFSAGPNGICQTDATQVVATAQINNVSVTAANRADDVGFRIQ